MSSVTAARQQPIRERPIVESVIMWMPRSPRESQVIDFLLHADKQPINYATEADLRSLGGGTRFYRQVHLGTGNKVLNIAHDVLTSWLMLPRNQVDLFWPDRATCPGTSLAIGMRLYGGYWLNPCRVTEFTETPVEEQADVVSRITWRTIRGHCLAGSETFAIRMSQCGDVHYEIESIAAPMAWLRPVRPLIDNARQRFQFATCRQFARIVDRYEQVRGAKHPRITAKNACGI